MGERERERERNREREREIERERESGIYCSNGQIFLSLPKKRKERKNGREKIP
jgi:hypothetical protein